MRRNDGDGEGVLALARQAAEGMADLVGKHLKLARLELTEDLVKVITRARLIAILGALVVVGYALVMAGLAVFVSGARAVGTSLLLVGGAHVGICGLGLLSAVRRLKGVHLMDDTAGEVRRSFALLGLPRGPATATLAPPA
jgi:Putative Actinobacterial Holin-X, holin superfamily III